MNDVESFQFKSIMKLLKKGPEKLAAIMEEDVMQRSNFSVNDEDKPNQFKNSIDQPPNNDVIDLQKKLGEMVAKLDKGTIYSIIIE